MKIRSLTVAGAAALVLGVTTVGMAAGTTTTTTCAWSDEAKLRSHMEKHVKYPTTGKEVKEACKKEAPEEFKAEERSCFEAKITDTAKFNDAGEVMAALGMKK